MEWMKVTKSQIGIGVVAVFIGIALGLLSEKWEMVNPAVAAATSSDAKARELATPANAVEEENGVTGWRVQNGKQIYLKNGKIVRGEWVGDYYLGDDGVLVKNAFVYYQTRLYHVGRTGICDRGHFFHQDKEYWADEDGALYFSDWVKEGDAWIYLDEDGAILKNAVTPDGYLLDNEGKIIDDGYSEYQGFQYSDKNLRLNTGAADLIWSYLKKKGWTDTAIAGLLGNFQQESHLSPSLIESNGIGFGLGQWSFGRRTALEAYAKGLGKPVNDMYMQLDYLMVEPGESNYVRSYMRTEFSSAAEATIAWCNNWERPNKAKARLGAVRIPYAMAYYEHYVNGVDYLTTGYAYEDPVYLDDEEFAEEEDLENDLSYTPLEDENGNPTLGWIYDAGGWWYRYPGGSYAQNEWKEIDGEWYYFGSDGYMESGQWIIDNEGGHYLLDEEGHIIPTDEELAASQSVSPVLIVGGENQATASDADSLTGPAVESEKETETQKETEIDKADENEMVEEME